MTARGWDCPQCRKAERARKLRRFGLVALSVTAGASLGGAVFGMPELGLIVLTLTVLSVALLGALTTVVGWIDTGELRWWL